MLIKMYFNLDDLEPLLKREVTEFSSQPIDPGSISLEFEQDESGEVDAVSITFLRKDDDNTTREK